MRNLLMRTISLIILLTVSCYAWTGVLNKETKMYKSSGDRAKKSLPILILEKGDTIYVHETLKDEYKIMHTSGAKGWISLTDVIERPSKKKYLTPEQIQKKRDLMEKMNIYHTASYHEARQKQRPPQNLTRDIRIQEVDSNNRIKDVKHIHETEILTVLNNRFLHVLNDGELQKHPIEIGIDSNAKNHVQFILTEKNEVSEIKLSGDIFLIYKAIFMDVLENLTFYHKASGKYLIFFPIRYKEN